MLINTRFLEQFLVYHMCSVSESLCCYYRPHHVAIPRTLFTPAETSAFGCGQIKAVSLWKNHLTSLGFSFLFPKLRGKGEIDTKSPSTSVLRC